MAAPINAVSATVTMPGGKHEKVAVQSQRGTTRIRVMRRGEVLEDRDDIATVTQAARGVKRVTFANGDEWTVQPTPRAGCRACGGGR